MAVEHQANPLTLTPGTARHARTGGALTRRERSGNLPIQDSQTHGGTVRSARSIILALSGVLLFWGALVILGLLSNL